MHKFPNNKRHLPALMTYRSSGTLITPIPVAADVICWNLSKIRTHEYCLMCGKSTMIKLIYKYFEGNALAFINDYTHCIIDNNIATIRLRCIE